MSHLDTALAYAQSGWPIFPLEPHGKQPLGRLVPHGLKDASAEAEIVRSWWNAEPQANIAVPTGILFDVADIDSELALTSFLELCKLNDTDPQSFPRAKTGRGGRHVFMAPTGVGNRTSVLPGLDWRGKGGYVVVPDSVHPSGTTYEWIHKVAGSPPGCPEWLLALITRPVVFQPSVSAAQAPEAYLAAAISTEMAKLRSTPIGQRNDQLNRSAFALGQMVGAGWMDRGRAEAELRAAAHAIDHGREPGLTATIMSGLEAGRAEPRSAPEGGFGGIIKSAQGLVTRTDTAVTVSTGPARPEVYSAAWLKDQDLAEPKAIVKGLFYVGLNMLAGKAKLGKSWLALSTAREMALGGKVLDSIDVEVTEVLYLALEDTRRRMKSRLKVLGSGFPDNLFIAHEWPKLDEGGVQAIEMWLDEHPRASMVIIDVWKRLRQKRAHNANLYDEDYEHLVPLQGIARRHEVAVLVVHHTRKAVADDVLDEISGTGGISAALDGCVVLHRTRSEADAELFITGRDLEEAKWALKFEEARWSLKGLASDVAASKQAAEVLNALTAAVRANGVGLTPSELSAALKKPSNTIRQRLFGMLTRGEVRRGPNTTYLPPLTLLTDNVGNRANSPNGEEGDGALGPLGVRAAHPYAYAHAREGCPVCGKLAYSQIGDHRRCHACGEVYEVGGVVDA